MRLWIILSLAIAAGFNLAVVFAHQPAHAASIVVGALCLFVLGFAIGDRS